MLMLLVNIFFAVVWSPSNHLPTCIFENNEIESNDWTCSPVRDLFKGDGVLPKTKSHPHLNPVVSNILVLLTPVTSIKSNQIRAGGYLISLLLVNPKNTSTS